MLVALNAIAASQSSPTQHTNNAIKHFLDYAACHPTATIRYPGSDMIIHIHSDASYLSEPNARSRAGGLFILSDKTKDPSTPPPTPPAPNGPLHV